MTNGPGQIWTNNLMLEKIKEYFLYFAWNFFFNLNLRNVFFCLFVCLFFCMSVCLFGCLFVCLFVCLFEWAHPMGNRSSVSEALKSKLFKVYSVGHFTVSTKASYSQHCHSKKTKHTRIQNTHKPVIQTNVLFSRK